MRPKHLAQRTTTAKPTRDIASRDFRRFASLHTDRKGRGDCRPWGRASSKAEVARFKVCASKICKAFPRHANHVYQKHLNLWKKTRNFPRRENCQTKRASELTSRTEVSRSIVLVFQFLAILQGFWYSYVFLPKHHHSWVNHYFTIMWKWCWTAQHVENRLGTGQKPCLLVPDTQTVLNMLPDVAKVHRMAICSILGWFFSTHGHEHP